MHGPANRTLIAVVDEVTLDRTRRTPRPYTHAAVYRYDSGAWKVLGFSLSEQSARDMATRSSRLDGAQRAEYRVVPLLQLVRGKLHPLDSTCSRKSWGPGVQCEYCDVTPGGDAR